jgi:uncharacterized membrane protein
MKLNPNYYYGMGILGFFGLFGWLMCWHTAWGRGQLPVAIMLLLTITPLLLPMRGLLHKNKRACTWAAYLSLAYFIHGSVEVYANAVQRTYLVWEVIFSLMLFFGTTLFVRFAGKTP